MDFQWITGGKQGSGIDSAQYIFSRAIASLGYKVFGYREYFSNIKGMHSFFVVRVSEEQKHALKSKSLIGAFIDKESVFGEKNLRGELVQEGHLKDIENNGTIIVDKIVDVNAVKQIRPDINVIQLDFSDIFNKVAEKLQTRASVLEISKNIIAVASSLYLLGVEDQIIFNAIASHFSKSQTVANMNIEVAKEVLQRMHSYNPLLKLEPISKEEMLLMEGFQAFAIGKAIGGCKLQVYYPITPASDESVFIEEHPELGIRVVQPESELAVIGIVTGANLAGVRAATSTSGPGLALMTETIAWAGMTETPIVVVDHQRGGPATGLPTRTEQGDLKFAVNLGHGDFNRIVIAPGDIEESIEMTAKSFNYAEMFQLPVIVLSEKAISQQLRTIETSTIEKIRSNYRINRGKLIERPNEQYKRYEFTNDNISPRIRVGNPYAFSWTAGDEHDEYGHISEEPNNRVKMMLKRNEKTEIILNTIPIEEQYSLYGNPSDLLIISWGTSAKVAKSVIKEGEGVLQLKLIEPLPKIQDLISKAKKVVVVEENITAQLKKHIMSRLGINIENEIVKANGRIMQEDELREALDKIKSGEKRVILNGY